MLTLSLSVRFPPPPAGLSWDTKSDSLHRHFAQYGEILEAVVLMDKATGRSKGYGFVRVFERSLSDACLFSWCMLVCPLKRAPFCHHRR